MKYANQEKDAVQVERNGKGWTVPRGHRFWAEFGIDKAEERGEIEPADETI